MAIDKGTESVSLAVKERTWRVEIFTDFGADPVVQVHRERVWLRDDGSLYRRETLPAVTATLTQIASFDLGGIDGAEMALAISGAGDALAAARDAQTGPFAA